MLKKLRWVVIFGNWFSICGLCFGLIIWYGLLILLIFWLWRDVCVGMGRVIRILVSLNGIWICWWKMLLVLMVKFMKWLCKLRVVVLLFLIVFLRFLLLNLFVLIRRIVLSIIIFVMLNFVLLFISFLLLCFVF